MASSEVDIANMALGYLGVDPIVSLDEDDLIETNYATIRDACLEDKDWTFATKRANLLSYSTTAPAFGYSYQYLLPTDTIRVIEVNENKYEWVKEGRYILTDIDDVQLKYIYRVEDVRQMPPSFVMAFSLRLASVIAIPHTNSKSIASGYMEMYRNMVYVAAANDGRQGLTQKIKRNVSLRRQTL